MNKKHVLLIEISILLIIIPCFIECTQNNFNSFDLNLGNVGEIDALGENHLKIAAPDKYISSNLTWGGSSNDNANGIGLDSAGNIYIAGYTNSFGVGGNDAFIAKHDNAGTSLLNLTWGGSNDDRANDIVLDGAGNVYITGQTNSFGAGGFDAFIVKYDSAGTQLWNSTWGDSSSDYALDISLDGAGNAYITGYTYSFGAGNSDAFIVKYDSAGTSLWDDTWGGSDYDYAEGIALDGAGNVYIAGQTNSFGAGGYDAFIAKHDSSGTFLWDVTWGGSTDDRAYDIALDGVGNIYITGETKSFGAGNSDAFIAKHDNAGTSLMNVTWGGSNNDHVYDITLDGAENVYIAGQTNSFGAGGYDAFIAKHDSTGTSLLNLTWGGSDEDGANGIALDEAGNIYITGYTYSFGAGSYDAFIAKYKIYDVDEQCFMCIVIIIIGVLSGVFAIITVLLIVKKRKLKSQLRLKNQSGTTILEKPEENLK